ncbi:DNA replication complex GINS protein psf3 [Thamnocephalis sphaerospora]|uniref:DNA replication complex GINS protein PSF3 n=1 Tax=Thamnocephalis sphaerospora TaxID=78915 RepID=A0A4P9XQK2_9FUNG|nr:DNA replication complex GINS protein psf3 [Thamnocephalis sphaerospora]|eukprot:RKP08192.1 DNA replication complex GINS protein psf3 [Thamnocephalis sphaerospora]
MDDYYDIDSILADQQRIPCTMNIEGTALGYLDNNPGEDLPYGSHLELPLWLAQALARSQQVAIDMPKAYGESMRNSMKASTGNIDLQQLGPYYYLFGTKLLALVDDMELHHLLAGTFRERVCSIMDYAHSRAGAEQTTMFMRMDNTERTLYQIGRRSVGALRRWSLREPDADEQRLRGATTSLTSLKRSASMM